MAVSGKTTPDEIPYFLDDDNPPNMATVTKAMADRVQVLLPSGTMKGDATLAKDGTLTIGAKAITLAKLAEAVTQALVPVSAVIGLRTTAIPSGFLLCDGSAVSRTTYAALFAAIGTEEGAGDGSTTFNLPDYRGRLLAGKGTHADVNALTDNDGLAVGSRTPKHPHEKGTLATGLPNKGIEVAAGTPLGINSNEHIHPITGSTASASGAYAVVNWIIKT
jgi:microcystin-dependent protein